MGARAEQHEEKEAERYTGTHKSPSFIQQFLSPIYIARWGLQAARLDKDEEESELLRSKTAADIMTNQVVQVGADEPIKKVVELMRGKGINRVPVVDGQGNLLGMITRADIIESLAKQLESGK